MWPRNLPERAETFAPQTFPCTAAPVFKTGALNRSATLPSPEFSDLAGGSAGGKWNCRSGRAQGACGARRGAQRPRSRRRDEVRGRTMRTRKPASSSRAARSRLQSKRGNRRIPSRDYACHTCHSLSSTEFVKTFGIGSFERGGPRARSGPRTKTLKCVGKENAGAKQTQTRCNCLNHRKTLRVLARTQRHEAAHSQKDSLPGAKIRPE